MSPRPSRCSAPCSSRIVRLSMRCVTLNAIRVGKFALIMPVITSTLGRCVARITCIPAARAFCASRAIEASTSLPFCIIRSANSSTTMTMNGSFSGSLGGSFSGPNSTTSPLAPVTVLVLGCAKPGTLAAVRALDPGIVGHDVARSRVGKQLVAPLHLVDRPLQRVGRLTHVRHDRQQHVRDPVEGLQLDDFGVDHEQPQVLGRAAVQQAHEHHVEADALACAGGACHEHVRHRGEIRVERRTDDVAAEHHGQRGLQSPGTGDPR